jgi:DNA invertase Pin-like site-specific DNA recombinase
MRVQQDYNVGIYCRLSVDDGTNNESMSIGNQRSMLSEYVNKQGWSIEKIYIDDGYSGTSFERPNFQQMIDDVERGIINLIICKDLSRLGRNYILCGQYTEIYFPSKNVRFIALNDGIDSLHSNNDIAPFKNILNDMYAKDISVKIKSSLHAKARKGEFLGPKPPYGFSRNPDNKNHLIVNHEVVPNILRMFELVISGVGLARIAKILNDEGVYCPTDYTDSKKHNPADGEFQPRYKWSMFTVRCVVENQMYLGHMVQCRKRSQSYRTHKIVRNDKEDWIIVENTHEAIISKDLYDTAQKVIKARTPIIQKKEEPNLFSGLFFCECGCRMTHHARTATSNNDYFACGKYYRQGGGLKACTSHYIHYDRIYEIVLKMIQNFVQQLENDEQSAIREITEKLCVDEGKRFSTVSKELEKQKKRQSEIDYRIKRVYEDNVSGKLSDELFRTFQQDYESEKSTLRDSIKTLETALRELEENRTDVSQFIKLLKQFAGLEELTRPTLMALINRIIISETKESSGKRADNREQTIQINYKFVGIL